jgi:uncharacterized membrane protein YccF (DUF307 family)
MDMKFLGNIIWFIFGGFLASLIWFILGLLAAITIIGIPLAKQFFKFSGLFLFPFGKEVETNFDKRPILNIIWAVLFGWEMAIAYLFISAIFFITVIGIPFGLQWLKLTQLALFPFGAKIK